MTDALTKLLQEEHVLEVQGSKQQSIVVVLAKILFSSEFFLVDIVSSN